MREVTIGGETHTIVASPLSLYIYSRAFGKGSDLIGDMLTFNAITEDRPEDADYLAVLKIAWALIKTAKCGAPFPDFESWLRPLEVDFTDTAMYEAVFGECQRGFFRGAATAKPADEPRQD
jgi:hypothetical protein